MASPMLSVSSAPMEKPTVVLVPVWGVGHFVPMLEVGKRLLARSGRSLTITVVVMPAPTSKLASEIDEHIRREEAAGLDLRFHHVPSVEPPTDHSGIEEFISRYMQLYAPHVKAAISGLTCPVAAVVVDLFCTTLFDATHELGVPAYVYMISSAAMCALMLRSPALDEEVAVEFDEVEGGVHVPGLRPVPPSCLPTGLENRKIPTYKWFVYNGRRYMEASGLIINTIAELEPGVLAAIAGGRCTRGVRAPPVYTIGPVIPFTPPAEQSHECVRWLDRQPPASVVFLCFGGGGYFTAPQAHEMAHALERSGHRFLWVLRGPPAPGTKPPTDGNLEELLPADFLEKTKGRGLVWPKRSPQKEILAHAAVGGFVTHCGWNSILESLWFGVPMVSWPSSAEQHYNAFLLVADMGVAVAMKVDRKRNNFVEAAELERAVKILMDRGEAARKVRDRAMDMKAACRKASEEGRSSYVSLQKLCKVLVEGAVPPKK
uniref:Malvidin galactosylase UGT88C3 n=1 Tax=Arundo donax TaxID=35708 RepID=A0A0A9B007_ARUDO